MNKEKIMRAWSKVGSILFSLSILYGFYVAIRVGLAPDLVLTRLISLLVNLVIIAPLFYYGWRKLEAPQTTTSKRKKKR